MVRVRVTARVRVRVTVRCPTSMDRDQFLPQPEELMVSTTLMVPSMVPFIVLYPPQD